MKVSATAAFCMCLLLSVLALALLSAAQDIGGVGVSILTWQQDRPTLCAGCVYRTGQNLAETGITYAGPVMLRL